MIIILYLNREGRGTVIRSIGKNLRMDIIIVYSIEQPLHWLHREEGVTWGINSQPDISLNREK